MVESGFECRLCESRAITLTSQVFLKIIWNERRKRKKEGQTQDVQPSLPSSLGSWRVENTNYSSLSPPAQYLQTLGVQKMFAK